MSSIKYFTEKVFQPCSSESGTPFHFLLKYRNNMSYIPKNFLTGNKSI